MCRWGGVGGWVGEEGVGGGGGVPSFPTCTAS